MQFTWEKYVLAAMLLKNSLCVRSQGTQILGALIAPEQHISSEAFDTKLQLSGRAKKFHCFVPHMPTHSRGAAFYPRSFAREGGNGEADAGHPAVGS